MRHGWEEFPLGQAPLRIIDGDRGKAYPKHGDFSDDGYCLFLSAANVTRSRFDFSACQFISEQKDTELRKGKLSRGDVILTTRGTLGNVALYRDDVPYNHIRINSGMVIMRADPTKLLPAFLYGFLRSPIFESQVEQLRSGVAQPQLPIRDINKIKLPLPPLEVQERIVAVFSTYDDLMENNRQQMELLEDAARHLYREWFVRLRYPGHEHDQIIDGVPKGWNATVASAVMDILSGGTPKTGNSAFWDGGIGFFTPKDATDQPFVLETEKTISEDGLRACNSKLYDSGTLFITARGTVGKLNLALAPMAMNQSCYALRSRSHLGQRFLYCALKSSIEQFRARATGAVFDAIIVATFDQIPFLIPPEPLASVFALHIEPMFDQIANHILQNRKLAQAQGLLLPRLMDGRISV